MALTKMQSANFLGGFAGMPSSLNDYPLEGKRHVAYEIDWNLYPGGSVDLDTNNLPDPFSQIAGIYINALNTAGDYTVASCYDTGWQLQTANGITTMPVPVITNGTIVNIVGDAGISGTTVVVLFNYNPTIYIPKNIFSQRRYMGDMNRGKMP